MTSSDDGDTRAGTEGAGEDRKEESAHAGGARADESGEQADGCASCPEIDPGRRRFLGAVIAGASGVAGAALAVPWVGLFVTPLSRPDADTWREVGTIDDFPPGETRKVVYRDASPLPWAGYAARSAAWVRRESDDSFAAFGSHCTHVGCVIRWDEQAQLFFCPCHGGAFHADGSVAAGPPPRPLDRHPIRVRGGRIEIQGIGIGASERSS